MSTERNLVMLDSLQIGFMGEQDYQLLEAMDLFERCLAEGSPNVLMAYIEAQIVAEPPRLELLHHIAQDLHMRLLALREYHFEIRARVLQTLRADFHADLSQIVLALPPQTSHLLDLDSILKIVAVHNPHLSHHEQTMLRTTLQASIDMAAQVRRDVVMTEQLFGYTTDWIDALVQAEARRSWGNTLGRTLSTPMH